MIYSETFSYQWDNLVNQFKMDMDRLPVSSITYEKVKAWYENRSYVWESFSETEGISLSNQKNKELSANLINAIKNFHFNTISIEKKPSPAGDIGVFGIAAVLLGIVLKLFNRSWIWVIIGLVLLVFGGFYHYALRLDDYEKKSKQQLIAGYAECMQQYKGKLLDICRMYAD